MNKNVFLPPEWYPQSGVMLTWPHAETDWANMLDEVESCFTKIAKEISLREKLLIVCKNENDLRKKLIDCNLKNVIFAEISTNDTWARDHAAITIIENGKIELLDFTFNGWGMKFAANFDNQINRKLFDLKIFNKDILLHNELNFVLEGGSFESDGAGTLLTTEDCLLSPNRNDKLSKTEIEQILIEKFGLKRILWLQSGYLAGDDTDSHIDTLARFCSEICIAYIKCEDAKDEHFTALALMEAELKSFRTQAGNPYNLVPLPMAEAVYCDGERLPATYANFLIINSAVLLPFYNTKLDAIAKKQLEVAFPDREIIGIDCTSLIKQHGSLHCVTMQFPLEVI